MRTLRALLLGVYCQHAWASHCTRTTVPDYCCSVGCDSSYSSTACVSGLTIPEQYTIADIFTIASATGCSPLTEGSCSYASSNLPQCQSSGYCVGLTACDGFATTTAASSGDPHLVFANGGEADFRGEDKKIFSFLSAPHLQVNVLTEDRIFKRWNSQVVNGSFITGVFIVAHSAKTNTTARVSIHATQWSTFRVYKDNVVQYSNQTHLYQNTGWYEQYPDIEMAQLRAGATFLKAAGWEVFVSRRRLRLPLIKGEEAPRDDPSRYFVDISFRVVDKDPEQVKKFGHSTVGWIAPHGIVGQSFDGSKIAVSGKLDKYGGCTRTYGDCAHPTFTTSAQGEGAIEGVYTDYIMQSPFATQFKYSRFDAKEPIGARNVSALTGTKMASQTDGLSATSTEQWT